jgi:hypothetical protein
MSSCCRPVAGSGDPHLNARHRTAEHRPSWLLGSALASSRSSSERSVSVSFIDGCPRSGNLMDLPTLERPPRDLVGAGPSLRRGAGSRRPGPPVADRQERGRARARPRSGGTAACHGAVANGPGRPLSTGDRDSVHPGDPGRGHRQDRKSRVTPSPERLRPGGQRSGGSSLVSRWLELIGRKSPPVQGPEQLRLSIERQMDGLVEQPPAIIPRMFVRGASQHLVRNR